LARLGAELLTETIPKLIKGEIEPKPQNHNEATYCPKITKEMGRINWERSSEEIFNMVRAFTPWPGAFTYYNGKMVKLTKVRPAEGKGEPGEVIEAGRRLVVATGKGALEILRIKPEGRKEISGDEFIRGYRVKAGDRFS